MKWMAVVIAFIVFVILFMYFYFVGPIARPAVPEEGSGPVSDFHPDLVTPGGIGFGFASSTHGLAVNADQVIEQSYIPPCDPDFDYCVYRFAGEYKGTTFDSAGLRIKERKELATKEACLTNAPDGYEGLEPQTREVEGYSTSVFAGIGDAGAGHTAFGSEYRLFFDTVCYELEARVGESNYDNYPAGSIKRFTEEDYAVVYAELIDIINTVRIMKTNTPVRFPALD